MLCQTKSFARMESVYLFKLGLSCQFDKQHLIDEVIKSVGTFSTYEIGFLLRRLLSIPYLMFNYITLVNKRMHISCFFFLIFVLN